MKPLHGLRVLDLSRVLAGPYATQILGDLGADVIKIEEPTHGDDTRAWGPPYFDDQSAYYLSANRNKRSRAMDLQNPAHLAELHKLLEKSDVLVENFKVDSLKKFQLDYASLAKKYPRLIYCSITGFGQTGPRAHEPGYDVMIQAMAGLMSITGPSESEPTKVGIAIADVSTGLYAVIGILAALRERDRSGLGQHLDLSLFDTQTSLLINVGMNYLCSGEVPKPLGNQHPSIVPYGAYQTKDSWILLSIGNDHQFERFCQCLGMTWHKEARFQTNTQRVENRGALNALIHQQLAMEPTSEWLERFQDQGFPFGPIQNLKEVREDKQSQARDLFTTMSDGKTPCLRSPLRFSRTPIEEYLSPPRLNRDPSASFD